MNLVLDTSSVYIKLGLLN